MFQPMPDDPYTIADLARLAGVTPRTVRYYVAQGLLPSPEAAGPGTRYSEGHLARLRLIRRLQRDHLPLAEIRSRLASLADEDVMGLVGERGDTPPATPAPTLAYVQDLMARSGVQPRVSAAREPAARYAARYEPLVPDAFPMRPAPAVPAPPSSVPPGPSPLDPRFLPPDRSTWERHALSPDVELHVRRPLDRRTNKRVEQLIRIARELFDDEA
jgi:DNA-binding transcriptional MerR regulator